MAVAGTSSAGRNTVFCRMVADCPLTQPDEAMRDKEERELKAAMKMLRRDPMGAAAKMEELVRKIGERKSAAPSTSHYRFPELEAFREGVDVLDLDNIEEP